ncbi:MAG TPA: BamA/TamA family outer membrane protein [Candidatus Syntrophosphaera sp.]|nr:BamA/TamA family outer membrane protein [Candidatus Syntrophosphaera sp.]
MKCVLWALLAALSCGSGYALTVEKISIAADFALDEQGLLAAAGLQTGESYDPATVNASIAEMQAWLQKNGHPWVRIPYPELIPLSESGMELSFRLEEVYSAGEVAVRFSGLRYFSEAKLRDLLLLGEDHNPSLSGLPTLLERVLDLYQQRGYLFAAVSLDSLVMEDGLTAFVGVNEGKPLRLERFYFQGNKYTRDKTLGKLSGLSPGILVTPALLQSAQDNILRKSYIEECQVEPVDPASVLIRVQEGRMTYLEGILGLGQNQGRTELTGLLRLQFLNLYGSDRSLGLHWRQSPVSQLLEFNYHESGPVAFPLAGDLALSRVVQDSTWIRTSIAAEIYSYRSHQRYGLELAAGGIAPGSRRPILVQRTAERSLGAFWHLDNRDQAFNPARGMQTEIKYRFRNADSGRRWSNALELDHTQYLGLARRWTASLGLHLRSLDDSKAQDYALYRMGGYNSLRGYREDEFSSWRLAWSNLELRYLIAPRSRIYLFYDHGLLGLEGGEFRYDILAPGVGLKLRTRLGVLSIEYGLGWRENGLADFGAGMIHAGLDTSF